MLRFVPWISARTTAVALAVATGLLYSPAVGASPAAGASPSVGGSPAAAVPGTAGPQAPALACVPRLGAPVVRAGETVEIRWPDAGPQVDELELLLSLDGGRTWPVRVSPELGGREIRFRWKVPSLAARDARLRLRIHWQGQEVACAPGAPFTIVAAPRRSDLAQSCEGAWWRGLAPLPGPARTIGRGHAGFAASRRPVAGIPPRTAVAATFPAPGLRRRVTTGPVAAILLPRRPHAVFRVRRE